VFFKRGWWYLISLFPSKVIVLLRGITGVTVYGVAYLAGLGLVMIALHNFYFFRRSMLRNFKKIYNFNGLKMMREE